MAPVYVNTTSVLENGSMSLSILYRSHKLGKKVSELAYITTIVIHNSFSAIGNFNNTETVSSENVPPQLSSIVPIHAFVSVSACNPSSTTPNA
jgi:hypothetical protein